jgi:ribosome-associated heat shock protein Hsp15
MSGTQRLDKWLWFARMAKTRSGAARLCEAGLVTVGGEAATKPNRAVRPGDRIAVVQGRKRRSLTVMALGDRRGAPPQARLLYDEPEAAVPVRETDRDWTPLLDEA